MREESPCFHAGECQLVQLSWLCHARLALPLSASLLRNFTQALQALFADVELATGEVVTAHCPNTGPMTGISTPGSPVQLSYSDTPTRKLPYTWEMIQVSDNDPTWVGVNTALPNRIIKVALEKFLFPELGSYSQVRFEVPYGKDKKSRVDFY